MVALRHWLSYGKNFVILTSTVFVLYVTNRRTDRQTDEGRAIAYSALSICYAVLAVAR